MNWFKKLEVYFPLIILTVVFAVMLVANIYLNKFKYENFDFGKFDLGNMTQMVWNTLHGRFLYLTDYFGSNVPRWSMSHVDPILLLMVPVFAVFPSPLTLVYSQVTLVLASCFILYQLSLLVLKNKWASLFIGLSFLFYPAIGYLTAQTTFHGVTLAIPFFLAAFYLFEKMHQDSNYKGFKLVLFIICITVTMMGKEQLPLYAFLYGLFILFFRRNKETVRIGVSLTVVSLLWFVLAFFVIIPHYAKYRIQSYDNFAKSMGITNDSPKDVSLENYFLNRYEAFGDSYLSMVAGILSNPDKAIRIFFSGDKIKNLDRTFAPLLYLPLAYPATLVISGADFFANYMTSSGGIGTSEIENHRVSMIIPVLFISMIFAVGHLAGWFRKYPKVATVIQVMLTLLVLVASIVTSFTYNNPVMLWLNQAVSKRFPIIPVYAKFDRSLALQEKLKIGEVVSFANLDYKNIDCSRKVVKSIPDGASVSGPDYLGSHLSMRETYAIFPALYSSADYVIVDVFSRKLLTILGLGTDMIKKVVENIIKNPEYELKMACGNLFIYQKTAKHEVRSLFPLQEKFTYPEEVNYEIYSSLFVVDYRLPQEIIRGENSEAQLVYLRRENKPIGSYILYLTFINNKTGEMYQAANLPSFSLSNPEEWDTDSFMVEDLILAIPSYVSAGNYRVFIGMSNNIKTRNLYLGDVMVR